MNDLTNQIKEQLQDWRAAFIYALRGDTKMNRIDDDAKTIMELEQRIEELEDLAADYKNVMDGQRERIEELAQALNDVMETAITEYDYFAEFIVEELPQHRETIKATKPDIQTRKARAAKKTLDQ